jgi:DNA-binding SARP family transcriptional activator
VLGEFAVDGLDLAALGGRKARQFLLLLALSRGRPAGVDRLIDALWGDHPPRNPGDQLAVLASRVRRQLGADRIVRGDEGYRLRYDWLDVDELDAVVAEAQRRRAVGNRSGAAAAARIALSLVRGEPTTAGMGSAWAGAQVAAVARAVAQARRVAARSLLEAGQPLDAVELLSAEVDREPYDEDAVRLLMRAEVAAGRPAAALAVFASCRARLAEELGAEPAPETSALHTAILRNELDTATRRLESGGRPMVGRDRELTLLDALLSNAGVGGRVVLILGEAGIGKSTLLTGWGRDERPLAPPWCSAGAGCLSVRCRWTP